MAILRNAWSLRSENLWCAGVIAAVIAVVAVSAAIIFNVQVPNCGGDDSVARNFVESSDCSHNA